MELLSPFRPGGTDESSQVVYGLGLYSQLERPSYLQTPLCSCFCPGAECAALWATQNDSPERWYTCPRARTAFSPLQEQARSFCNDQAASLSRRGRRSKEAVCAAQAVALAIPRGRNSAESVGYPSRRAVRSAALKISPRPSSVGSAALRSRSSLRAPRQEVNQRSKPYRLPRVPRFRARPTASGVSSR